MLDNNKLQEYFDLYNNYTKTNNLGNKYLKSGEIVIQAEHYRVLYYSVSSYGLLTKSSNGQYKKLDVQYNTNTFLIIPSIFNSPEIFFLARDRSFIDNLRRYGEVYLIDWLQIEESQYCLDDYVNEIIEVIDILKIKDINLIGHCIGGNLAIAANVLMPQFIKTLTLLTCPWDFSHFFYIRMLYSYLKLDSSIVNLSIIPKIHIQILFFLLSPDCFNTKLKKFFSITSDKEQELAFRIEHWLMSGHNISKGVYNQIIQNILYENMFINLKWKINNFIIDPSLIDCSVYIVSAENDQIVPKSSILTLQKLLQNSKLIEVKGGHISYLINDKLDKLLKEYTL
ncbi:poly-beta-hydroxybutyrate polymerase [Rickettsia prowazekii str. GvV257]|uniref:POLY-BETA-HYDROXYBUTYRATE POLYMERASE (PhbC1) n=2 Tax=Rickettsia prowazekii TaxID=782 RepID=Q9ZCJ4_RICPR|nr:alpha/beta hydrolase [Rickettsia prowazekii]ADE30294.1 Poly-beta-hydroxybutyrate polymerase [Rickettsia prowazekii str. Rp22]AFE49534.1 poly-beta-hydroxybutyrate polymerase [Rickettsia prowazekii str. Chernikova]AFE50378.1 poly-beta-hydroxybutyrate polymerase [Rickettsia prowazekii str. Katsinyian]AFE51223.1 poly-beta-hydroxybutyrate polymerase [Rickettsia prowazekii str. BuV67-CWPP]AFE52060.1 poly-beta-hydroxybutyrate polymerase [Rickettsia prowazekii str. Dachau]